MKYLIAVALLLSCLSVTAQSNRLAIVSSNPNKVEVLCKVLDEENALEPLAFAQVLVRETAKEYLLDANGSLVLKLRPGTYTIELKFLGYQTKVLENIEVMSGEKLELRESMKALTLEPDVSFDALFTSKSEK